MKKTAIVIIFALALGVAGGCGTAKKAETPKTPAPKPAANAMTTPEVMKFPPATAQDKTALEATMKSFWSTLSKKDFAGLTKQMYKPKAESAKSLEENMKKNEVGSVEFVKMTGVTANNGLAAVGYIALEAMGNKKMTTKYPDVGVLALAKEGNTWKVVMDKDNLKPQEVTILSNMVMQEQQNMQKDPDFGKYQKQQQAFMVEAQATKQKFIQQAPAAQAQPQMPPSGDSSSGGMPPTSGGSQLPPGHPSTGGGASSGGMPPASSGGMPPSGSQMPPAGQ
jgi:hypothetical protein